MNEFTEEMRTYNLIEKDKLFAASANNLSMSFSSQKITKDAILGIVLKAMEQGGFNTHDTMVIICEVNEIIDNSDYDELKEEYKKWLREARYEKNTFRKISKRVCNFFNKDKRPE